jgi:hypothetical protein
MAMKWLILYSRRRRNEKSMAQRLASECLAAAKEEAAVKKRMDTHKMAEANKASLILDFNFKKWLENLNIQEIGIAAHIDAGNNNN